MKRLKAVLPYIILLAIAIVVIANIFPSAHTNGGIDLPLDASAITGRATVLLDSMHINVGYLSQGTQFQVDKKLLRQAQQMYGITRSNTLIRSGVPAYFWDVSWKKKQVNLIGIVKMEENEKKDYSSIAAFLRGDINIHMTPGGTLLSFAREISDSVMAPALDSIEARRLAEDFLTKFSPYSPAALQFASHRKSETKSRTDHEFSWFTMSPQLRDTTEIKVHIAGNIVSKFSSEYRIPDQYAEKDSLTYDEAMTILLFAALIILLLVVGFKRLRAYEIGFRTSLMAGILVALAAGLEIAMTTTVFRGWELLIPLLLNPLFLGGSFIVLWAVVETVVRETWKEKFIAVDLLRNGHFLHSRIGEGLIRGAGLGAGAIALSLALTFAANALTPLWTDISSENLEHLFTGQNSGIILVSYSVFTALFTCAFFILFPVPLLHTRIKRGWIVVAVCGLLVGVSNFEHIQPAPIGMILYGITGIVFVWALCSFDVLTALMTMFTWLAGRGVATLLSSGNTAYAASGWGVIIFFGVVLLFSIASLYRKKEITDFDAITPAFAQHISERQRLQQEIEIARQVQMSLLPKAGPQMAELDIASRCVPAQEIGGDYYDFIRLGPDTLAIAVGDVSGKGTQAAFFMTLTKGFLRALVKMTGSPATVLTQMNRLFYENVERGVFISMLYAVVNTKERCITLARAGQNPAIVYCARSKQIDFLKQNGLALGLDPSGKFSEVIQEVNVPYEPGDLFVFYTDGFPEAMNKKYEEYGDERFSALIRRHTDRPAGEIVEEIFKEMKRFTGAAQQHDDMTIVVVKIAGGT